MRIWGMKKSNSLGTTFFAPFWFQFFFSCLFFLMNSQTDWYTSRTRCLKHRACVTAVKQEVKPKRNKEKEPREEDLRKFCVYEITLCSRVINVSFKCRYNKFGLWVICTVFFFPSMNFLLFSIKFQITVSITFHIRFFLLECPKQSLREQYESPEILQK